MRIQTGNWNHPVAPSESEKEDSRYQVYQRGDPGSETGISVTKSANKQGDDRDFEET